MNKIDRYEQIDRQIHGQIERYADRRRHADIQTGKRYPQTEGYENFN